MELDRLRENLSQFGYAVLERQDGWAECLIVGHGECWHGRGLDAEEAFRAAIARCFPSRVARVALEALLEARAAGLEVEAEATTEPQAEAGGGGDGSEESGQGEAEGAVEASGVDGSRDTSDEPAPLDPSTEPRPAVRERQTVDEVEALEELSRLEGRILAALPEVAGLAVHRQRLVLLGWLAQVRHLQDTHPHSIRLNAAATRVVRLLRQRSDCWWPGMITAFRQNAHPAAAARDFKQVPASSLFSWGAVAEAAEQELLEVEASEAQLGRDDWGWADRSQISPPPRDPDLLFAEVKAEVETHGGDIHGWQPKEVKAPGNEDLLRWVRQVRWLRGKVDREVWGALVGRLRFWAGGAANGAAAREMLDPGFKPGQSWASMLLAIESEKREALELEQVLGIVPAEEASEEEIVAWLARALPLTTRHRRAIEKAVRPLADRLWAIDEDQLLVSDRRIRRRLQKLKEALADPVGDNGSEAPAELPSDVDTLPPETAADVPEILLDETSGLRVLYVSNRSEAALQERLQERFGFSELSWDEATPRRVAAATEAIATGSFDMVLGATGFLGHSSDGLLSRACKAAGIPYVRVNKGKAGLVQFSLERDLLGIAGRERE